MSKKIRVETSDPAKKGLVLCLKAEVVETLAVTPYSVYFGMVAPGKKYTREMTVSNKGTEPVTIKSVAIRPERFLNMAPKDPIILKPGQSQTYTVTFTPGAFNRRFTGIVTLNTNLDYLPRKIVRIRAQREKTEK